MKKTRIPLGLLLCSLMLTACDPKFETTSDQCSAGEDSPVRANYTSFRVASEDKGEYEYYLQNIMMGLTPATSQVVTVELQEVLDNLMAKINQYMDYEVEDGVVLSANNPLDFMEYLISSTDQNQVIGAFQDALRQIADGIQADDGVCNYSNSNIELNRADSNPDDEIDDRAAYQARFSLTYTPFDRDFVQQALVLQAITTATDDPTTLLRTPYTGLYQAPTENFKAQGFTEPALRQALMNNPKGTESLSFDDGRDIVLGQVLFSTINTYCEFDKAFGTPDPAQYVVPSDRDRDGLIDGDVDEDRLITGSDYKTCTEVYAGTDITPVIRTPAKPQCMGGVDAQDRPLINEVGKIELRSFDLSSTIPELMGLQRFRVEVDYDTGETRIYGSKYREAIYDPLDTLVIDDTTPFVENPTRCETQAVLDELAELTTSGVRVTARPDPNYDIVYALNETGQIIVDADGHAVVAEEPTPLLTFQGRPAFIE